MSGLSLWLSPPPSSKLSGFIREQAAQLAAASPTFASHATLVSDEIVPAGVSVEDLVAQIKTGVARWKAARGAHGALTLPLDDVRQGPKYFQCVLAKLQDLPELFELHESLLTAFGLPVPSPPTYYPHLSLVYGDYTQEEKARIIAEMKQSGKVVDSDEGVEIVGEKGFTPTEVLLVRTGGKIEEWEVLARVPL